MSQSLNLILDTIIVFIGLGKWANDGLNIGIFLFKPKFFTAAKPYVFI